MKTIYSKKNPPKWINGWISLEKTLQYLVCPCYKSKVGRKIAEISLITYQMLAWAHWILATQTPLNRTQTTITTTTTRTTTEKQTNLVVHPTAHIVMLLRIICMYHREKAWACGLNAIQITCQNAFQLLYHTFWCKFTHQHISLKKIFCRTFYPFIQNMMPMPCIDVHSGAPISHFLNRRFGMGYQALNFRSRANYVFKMSRMHACLFGKCKTPAQHI